MRSQFVTTSIRLPQEMHQKVRDAAKRENRTMGNLIQVQLEKFLESRKFKNEKDTSTHGQ